ncbi:hypothetical protein VNO78_01263 [Psophocarpus tetragonolobus]|uniref:Uncharacterized protein n=1 Tax=Psophocarpus tetragonolobus TaxID=3891 RepID=A0AAN9XUL2_PSOTE
MVQERVREREEGFFQVRDSFEILSLNKTFKRIQTSARRRLAVSDLYPKPCGMLKYESRNPVKPTSIYSSVNTPYLLSSSKPTHRKKLV